jgi:hypothetical protein
VAHCEETMRNGTQPISLKLESAGHSERDCLISRAQADSETVWAAFVFAVGSSNAIGAIRASKRLHRTQIDARREAERWAEDMRLGPLRWEIVDDQSLVGHCGDRAVVLPASYYPPKLPTSGRPAPARPDRRFDLPQEVQLFDASSGATARVIWLTSVLGHDGSEALICPE